MGAPNFWREYIFASKIFLEMREEKKSHRGLYQGDRVNVLEHRPHVFTKKRRRTSGLVT